MRLSQCTLFRVKNDLGHFRLGITLKARGTSVERNRVKRRIREEMRRHRQVLGPYDYNVVVPGSRKMTYDYADRLARALAEELPRVIATK